MTITKTVAVVGLALLPGLTLADVAAGTADEIVVVGRSVADQSASVAVGDELLVDTAAALRDIPGAAVNTNGAITGIAQYRGMFGDRIAVQIDQLGIISGGPNAMDSPLSYMSPMMTEKLTVARGVASVSLAPEAIGGHVSATMSRGAFGTDGFGVSGLLGSRYSDNGYVSTSTARLTLADHQHRISAIAESDRGSDIATPVGKLVPTRVERDRFDLSYAYDNGSSNVLLFAGKLDTGRTGTPALPMDIVYIDTQLYGAQFGIDGPGPIRIDGRFHYNDVDHGMDNFSLREAPVPMRQRFNTTSGSGSQFYLAGNIDRDESSFVFGVDGVDASHESVITNPTNEMFRISNFVDVERTLIGSFVQWRFAAGSNEFEFGGRVNRISTDAGTVSAAGIMGPAGELVDELARSFNTSQRRLDWNTMDAVVKYRYAASPNTAWTVEAGRKSRAPSYQELYLWLPMEATAGLADGRTYIGNLALEEERSTEFVIGLATGIGSFSISPQVFYREVDDYILGVPSEDAVADAVAMMMSGKLPLQFDNVDAEIWGLDVAWNCAISGRLTLDGMLSMVRGRRKDTNDDLYRLSPFNGRVGLAYAGRHWLLRSDLIGYADQDRVSALSNETGTAGYWLVNVGFSWNPASWLRLEARVANLFDETYQDHVTGINRATGSDIPVGERLYGAGRTLSAGVILNF